MSEWDYAAFENAIIDDMRAHGGEVTTGPLAGEPLLVMVSTGARTGQPRRAILNFTRDGADYVVAGTAGGSPKDPSWLANVRANPEVSVEAQGRSFKARATVANATDRERLWQRHVDTLPKFADYPKQTGRVIPMVRLTPVAGS